MGKLRPLAGEDPEVMLDDIWQKIRPKLVDWLSMPLPPAAVTMALGEHIRLEVAWAERHRGRDGAMTLEVPHERAALARYLKSRRRIPLFEHPPTPEEYARQRCIALRRKLVEAISRSRETADPKLARLPGLIRYRVCGAMAAWHAVREALDEAASPPLTRALQETGLLPLVRDTDHFTQDLLPDGADGLDAMQVRMIAQYSIIWLAFELRKGVFYEPTPPLHRLLDASYIADDVPIGMLRLPADTLCIIPEPVRWMRAGDVEAIAIFRTGQRLDFVAWTYHDDGAKTAEMNLISLSLADPEKTIHALLGDSFRNASQPEDAATHALWRNALDYAIKMLLYLNARDAHIVHERAYSEAPRSFSGLGQRRRAQRLAEIEQLYDRHIVGPAILDGDISGSMRTDGMHHEVRGHWRRPHFRMQPHGPQASLRKLIFVGPTIVRADRLQ
ncbi:hypothetical protein A6456_34755 [Paraburkholderia tropica]|nr:hypothetical protein A6456_34755 [Paraburkholderia tropica]